MEEIIMSVQNIIILDKDDKYIILSSNNDKLAFILYSMNTYEDALKTMESWALNFQKGKKWHISIKRLVQIVYIIFALAHAMKIMQVVMGFVV